MSRRAAFSRTSCWVGKYTWSYSRFKEHHTELNRMYWSYAAIAGIGQHLTNHQPPKSSSHGLLHVGGPDTRRVPATVETWRSASAGFGNWARLNAVMSVSSYLEVYLRSAIRFAILSDPGLLIDASGSVDGVQLLLSGRHPDTDAVVTSCTKGDWQSRVRCFRSIFRAIPVGIEEAIPHLERLRLLRNSVGHYFGRPSRKLERLWDCEEVHPNKVSESKLKEILQTVETIAEAYDQLLLPHIGNFETISVYLEWKRWQLTEQKASYSKLFDHSPRLFCVFLASHHKNRSPGPRFVEQMIAYLNDVQSATGSLPLR